MCTYIYKTPRKNLFKGTKIFMYVLLETLNLEIILGHLGKKLFYSFKKFLHSWEILFCTTPRMSGHTKQDIL